jgi:PAS domain S-box-containing protein
MEVSKPLRVLIIEDSEDDALLLVRELEKSEYEVSSTRVDTAKEMRKELEKGKWDIVISDYKMPHFSGLKALAVLNESGLDIPFILVSGTIGEGIAVEVMKAGASDYIMKDAMKRLGPAVKRELEEASNRRERKRVEEALRESEEKYRNIFDLSPDAILILGPDGKVLDINSAALNLSQVSREDVAKNILDSIGTFFDSDALKGYWKQIWKRIDSEETGSIDVKMKSRDGVTHWLEVRVAPIMSGREVRAIQVIGRDVTERKVAESLLRESERRLREAQSLGKMGNWDFDVKTRKIQWSDEVYAIFERERSLGPPSQEEEEAYYPPEQAIILRDYARRAIETGMEFRYDLRANIPSGKTGYFTATMRPVKDESGKVVKLIGTVQDITDRRIMEDRLRESEKRYRLITDNMLDLIIQVNMDGTIEYASPSHTAVLGYEPHNLVGKNMLFLLHPDDLNYAQEKIQETLSKQTSGKVEVRVKHADGHFVWIEISGSLIKGPDGEPIGGVLTGRDISEKKNADILLRESEEKYRLITENMGDVVWLMDFNLKPTYISPSVVRIGGYTLEELQALPLEKIVIPASVEKVLETMAEELTPERLGDKGRTISKTMEIGFIRRDGTTFWTDVTVSIIRDAKGDPVSILCSGRDMTERRKAQEVIRRSEEKFRALVEKGSDVLLLVGDDGLISYVSPSFKPILGREVDEIEGKNVNDFIHGFVHEDDKEKVLDEFSGLLDRSGAEVSCECRFMHSDGTLHHVIAVGINHLSEPAIGGIVVNVRDITERKTRDAELKQAMEELVKVNRDLRQFAYVASHDLQEPLRTISSFAQLIEKRYKGKLDSDADEFIAFMIDGTARMQNMINGLLTYSRLGTRGKPFQKTDCEKVLGDVVENMKASIEESGATVTHDPLPKVTGDDSQLSMLLQNLISNSIKFHGKEPPKIHVSAKKGENEWVFSVSDNGIGIDPNYWEKIFIIFQRLHTAQEYPGTGLGLAICKKIVERHGGRIWLESQIGKGTVIHFTIPFEPTRRIEKV